MSDFRFSIVRWMLADGYERDAKGYWYLRDEDLEKIAKQSRYGHFTVHRPTRPDEVPAAPSSGDSPR